MVLVVATLTTLKEALVQAWHYHLHNLELDLIDDIIAPLTTGPHHCKPSLTMIVIGIRELSERDWVVNINYAHKSINLVAAVLANINEDQTDDKALHVFPPSGLHATLDLDVETFLYAQRLQEDINNLLKD